MGPIRRRLITGAIALSPTSLWADVCSTLRPDWDGEAMTALSEFLWLLQTPIVLLLIVGTALAVRFRHEWGGLIVVVGWSLATFLITGWGSQDGTAATAMIEGCVGPSWLFIGMACALCIGVVVYTAPLKKRDTTTGDDDA